MDREETCRGWRKGESRLISWSVYLCGTVADDYSSFGLRIFFSATRETSFLLLCSARIVGVLLEIFGRASVNYERLMLRNSFGSVDRLKKWEDEWLYISIVTSQWIVLRIKRSDNPLEEYYCHFWLAEVCLGDEFSKLERASPSTCHGVWVIMTTRVAWLFADDKPHFNEKRLSYIHDRLLEYI